MAQLTMTPKVDLTSEILTDSDVYVRRVGKLFLNLGFEPIAHHKELPALGEIDLAFKFQREGFLITFIVEVSHESQEQNQKISHFFSRWSNATNLASFLGPLQLTATKNLRIYVDLSRDRGAELTSIQHHLEPDIGNRVLFDDDIEYFESMAEMIGKWAKSDLLSYLGIPRSQTLVSTPAFQFYLEGDAAFCFLCDVRTLLDSCYISRRLGDQKGYQRALDKDRIRRIGREIEAGKIAAFPNSIIINCEQRLTDSPARPDECPKGLQISLPTSFCSCLVIDGQHRLLGFSRINETLLIQRYLPVVAFQQLSPDKMVKLFVDINSKQKRIDNNLILDLKADFAWNPELNYREHSEKIIVRIAREINEKGPLRDKIFLGGARETKGEKITLATFVSVIKENQLVGGKRHFWQRDPKSQDMTKPLKEIKGFFSSMFYTFAHKPNAKSFLLSNMGLRMVFRVVQILERNSKAGTCRISKKVFLRDLKRVLDDNMISDLQKLYGVGGKVEGAKRIIQVLEKQNPQRYKRLNQNFRGLSRKSKSK